jgi:hypothetical protein
MAWLGLVVCVLAVYGVVIALAVAEHRVNGSFEVVGRCAFGDADGDKMFFTFIGKGTDTGGEQGVNTIFAFTAPGATLFPQYIGDVFDRRKRFNRRATTKQGSKQ